MSSYEKVVKLACKPKAAPPKAKYLDPIIAATWDDGGAVHDVCKALSPRFREPNAIVVFKALIVLHTMIRNGSTDNVLGYLSGSQVLRLSNVSTGSWEGYTAPENLQHYAAYMDARIHAYRDLKHDAVRVQSDSNRDARTTAAVNGGSHGAPLQRSKTLAGRKLRSMTVEKGLLRETRAVHRMLDTLVACRFYLDDLEDPLTLTALRMLVKDLLILFQAGNEGVINLLEHYFEMSHTDATEALAIYRHFCTQTEQVVEYLGVARKLQNLLNVPVPNLKHAPVSLAGALQEYLDDPMFEQNRIEYRTNKEAVKRGGKAAKASTPPVPALPSSSTTPAANGNNASASGSANGGAAPAKTTPDVLVDFFAAIEDTQPTMFNPATNSPNTAYFQQNAVNPNPFQRMQAQPTGFNPGAGAFGPQPTGAFGPQPTGAFGPQPTGAFAQPPPNSMMLSPGGGGLQPQATGFNPFARPVSSFGPLGAQATGMGMGAFGGGGGPGMMQQPTGAFGGQQQQQPPQQQQQPSFLRPQMTGGAANPFRASMAMGNGMGIPPPPMPGSGSMSAGATGSFGGMSGGMNGGGMGGMRSGPGTGLRPQMTGGGTANPFRASTMFSQGTGPAAFNSVPVPAIPPFALGNNANANNNANSSGGAGIARPASAPLNALASASSPALQPVKTHQTGTRNPFGQPAPKEEPLPMPARQPTLMELAMGSQQQQMQAMQQQQQAQQQAQQQQVKTQATGFAGSTTKAFDYGSSALGPGGTDISSVASEFAFKSPGGSGSGSGVNGERDWDDFVCVGCGGIVVVWVVVYGRDDRGLFAGIVLYTVEWGVWSPTTGSFSGSGFNPANSALNNPSSSSSSSGLSGGFNPANSALNNSASSSSSSPGPGPGPGSSGLTTQMTGGMKAFKPSSSFGASLLEALPPIPGSAPGTPNPATMGANFFGAGAGPSPGSTGGFGAASTNPTGAFGASTGGFGVSPTGGAFGGGAATNPTAGFGGGGGLGVGLRPQMTGGAANPFRASMAMGNGMGMPPPMPGQPTGAFGGGGMGANLFGGGGGAFGSPSPAFGGAPGQGQGQQQQNASLI
ncbi:ANTH-domain-containing protein [Mycena alexandri]|uniref:ANTH-domain-containing protein n=1 Tax=Mycena alexandri TaxID=1745969 RepID=A0AAD6S741_9AGAR|nr:ANTH-domain-containing protein [Mycena alexandri]